MPKLAATAQKQSEAAAEALKKMPLYVEEGGHNKPVDVGGRTGYVISYRSRIGDKSLYNMQVTVTYDEERFLVATCSYEISLIDDISEEMLKKVQELKFLSE
jgi:hypothetical protein